VNVDRHAPSRQEKSKRPSEHSRRLDDDDGDDHPPSATSHIESNKDMATGIASHLADETLADVEHVEQLVLLGDATSTNGRATASPRSRSSSLEWPGSDVDFTQIEEHEDPYEVEPETKAFDEDISDDESDAYKPDDDNEDADKVRGEEEEEEEEEEEVLLSPKVIQTKGKARTAPSKVRAFCFGWCVHQRSSSTIRDFRSKGGKRRQRGQHYSATLNQQTSLTRRLWAESRRRDRCLKRPSQSVRSSVVRWRKEPPPLLRNLARRHGPSSRLPPSARRRRGRNRYGTCISPGSSPPKDKMMVGSSSFRARVEWIDNDFTNRGRRSTKGPPERTLRSVA
jgi:hypothetical protein